MRARQSKGPAEFTLAMIGGGWKILLIFHLLAGVKRFSELRGVTQKVSPKVEYSLTPLRRSFKLVIDAMCRWGDLYGLQTADRQAQS